MTKLRFASVLAGLAVLAACADTPTTASHDDATPRATAALNGSGYTQAYWEKDMPAPPGFTVSGGTLACADAGVKLDMGPGVPTSGTLAGGAISYTVSGGSLSFTSTIPITYADVKGGPASYVYTFTPPSYGASGLVTPDNPSGGPAAVSHFSLCVGDPSPTVTLAASGSFTRPFDWDIAKAAGTATWLPDSLGADQPYTVTLTKTALADRDSVASGTVTISNPTPFALTLVGVSVSGSGLGPVAASCPTLSVPASGSVACTWSDSTSATSYSVTVDVDNTPFTVPGLDGSINWLDVTASGSIAYTPTLLNDSVTLSDDLAPSVTGSHSASDTVSYSVRFTWLCGQGLRTYTNTARIVGGSINDSAQATVSFTAPTCPPPPPVYAEETAFAYGAGAIQFNNKTVLGKAATNRWGWVLPIAGPGTYTYDVIAGAGSRYNLSNVVGSVTVTYAGGTVTAVATPRAGCTLPVQHLYAGKTPVPPKGLTANGQFAVQPGLTGAIYVIVHFESVCEQ